tara:strand:+ start:206 stop:421 length:216 start_codon:yes stop_codon:yes gene_type:complete
MSFKGLVTKLQKGGKSTASAKNIAGAVANKKRKGEGTGPTAKQKESMSPSQIRKAARVQKKNTKMKTKGNR